MAKDPAFLFYSQDFFVGVATMSFEDRGKYITLLCLMHQQGRMSEETIRLLVGSVSVNLKSKFSQDENGFWFNERLEAETEKRIKFTESRRLNGLSGGRPKASGKPKKNHMDNHMEDENGNGIVIKVEKKKGVQGEKQNLREIEIVEYLNQLNGTNFRTDTKATIRLIGQRLGDGYTVQELKEIIEYKIAEWKGTEWERFLQPDTLFNGEKCAKYRNQVQAAKDKGMTSSQIKGKNGGKTKPTMEGILNIIYKNEPVQ